MRLIIAEKPSVASKIASFLGKKVVRKREKTVNYYEIENGEVVVVPAVGHLFTLAEKKRSNNYPVFDVEWVPIYKVDKSAFYAKPYLDLLYALGKKADELIVATDYDTEGSLIGYNIFRFCFGKKSGKRMRFSAITPLDIKKAYEKMEDLDYLNAYAGEARHILDWYYGINLSRALMHALRMQNLYRVLSIGRVQGPTLAILAEHEKKIKVFVPTPYWQIFIWVKGLKFEHEKGRFEDEEKAKMSYKKIEKKAVVETIRTEEKTIPPLPAFDLTSLQLEAYRHFKFSPAKTLQIAQSLYENSYISYPRTSSQKLPPTIGFRRILEKIKEMKEYSEHAIKILSAEKLKPVQGKKDDPAHPAIHPTGIYGKMSADEKKLYDLIVRRFLSAFGKNALKQITTAFLNSGGEKFFASTSKIVEKGWTEFYAPYYTLEENEMPDFKEGEEVDVEKKKMEKKMTKPPKRYTQASLVAELEKRKLGTKATRAAIIETLFKRNYIKGKSIEVTEFGMTVYEALKKNAPSILDEELTRKIEIDMERIQSGEVDKEKVIEEGKKAVLKILNEFSKCEREIGEMLKEGLFKTEEDSVVGKCECGGKLKIIKYKKSAFVGCTNYPNCKNSFPLPSGSLVIPLHKNCSDCGFPMVRVYRNKKRFDMCINTECKSKEKWKKKDDNNGN